MAPIFELVVCITSTALFDCSESHELWKHNGIDASEAHQRSHVHLPLKPGIGFQLVQSLLELNTVAGKNLVDVVLISRNNGKAGERIRYSIEYYNLPITRMSFICGNNVIGYLPAWKCDLFLSTDECQVREILSGSHTYGRIAAALVGSTVSESVSTHFNCILTKNNNLVENNLHASSNSSPWPEGQIRIVFDGDGVLFSDESDRISKEQGLQAFFKYEHERKNIPLSNGPMKTFALKLQKVRQALEENNQWRIRTFLVTSRNGMANPRAFHTLESWKLDIDEQHCLGGLDKTPFLRFIDPTIFFDDSPENIDQVKLDIPSAHVVYGIRNVENGLHVIQ